MCRRSQRWVDEVTAIFSHLSLMVFWMTSNATKVTLWITLKIAQFRVNSHIVLDASQLHEWHGWLTNKLKS